MRYNEGLPQIRGPSAEVRQTEGQDGRIEVDGTGKVCGARRERAR